MRQILLGDLAAAARVVMGLPEPVARKEIRAMLAQAHLADCWRKRTGRGHPRHGDGSLMAVALARRPPPEPFAGDAAFLAALGSVIAELRLWRDRLAVLPGDLRGRGPGPVPAARKTALLALSENSAMIRYAAQGGRRGKPMVERRAKLATLDPVWNRIRQEAEEAVANEPLLGGVIHSSVLHHPSMERALAYRFSLKLASGEMSEQILREIADEAYADDPWLGEAARADLVAVFERDPACNRFLKPLLYFKGYQALQAHRVAHWLCQRGRVDMASFIQMRMSEEFSVDIHPAAKIGKGVMMDHAHAMVIGETAVVGDNVSMLHSVTLGGTGKEDGDRHPKIGSGVLIGAGAKVLGNIRVGNCSRIAAGSVVLEEVPPKTTVAGVPARIVGEAGCETPSVTMDQLLRGEI